MTPRPMRMRRIWHQPDVVYFKPVGIPLRHLEEVVLTMPEVEALRLCDAEKCDQKKCAKKMDVSQPTFSRILDSARKKLADAIVKGKAIKVEGGNYKMVKPQVGRRSAATEEGRGGYGPRSGRFRAPAGGGRGGQGGFAAGPEGFCICPKCKTKVKHAVNVPCYTLSCPKCETPMTRE